jgi:competence protein ComEC
MALADGLAAGLRGRGAVDPWALTQAGFWLSFVAVGVLFATDSGAKDDPSTLGWGYFFHKARQLLREQAVVTLALTPLSLLLFGQVSVVGLVANLLAIPWITLVVTPLALAGVLLPALWDFAAWTLGPLAALLGWLASLPFATVSMAATPLWAGVAGVTGGVLLAARLPWGVRALGLPLLLPVLLWQAPRPAPGEFELLAADVGQGNAVLVRTAGHALVYDAGPRFSAESDAGHRVLVPLLRALDERVDALVLSHRDTDHTGGARAVLAMQPQADLLSSIEDSHELQAPRAAMRCMAGQRWTWDGVTFEFLHPQEADYDSGTRSNAMSCVLRIGNGRRTALLAGDIEAAQEARLVASGDSLRADLLLMPHHGSKTSSAPRRGRDDLPPRRHHLCRVWRQGRRRRGHRAADPVRPDPAHHPGARVGAAWKRAWCSGSRRSTASSTTSTTTRRSSRPAWCRPSRC